MLLIAMMGLDLALELENGEVNKQQARSGGPSSLTSTKGIFQVNRAVSMHDSLPVQSSMGRW